MGRRVEIQAEFPDAGIGLLVVREPPTQLAEHDHPGIQVPIAGRGARYAAAWHGAAGRSQRSPYAAPGLMVVPSGAPHRVDWTAEATLAARALAAGFGSYAQFHRVHCDATGEAPSARKPPPLSVWIS